LVNLSDGGHLENMGLYELVRRRCKFIIVCDSEADKEISCHGFADSIRMILIDMGVRIHIDLSDIYRETRAADGSFVVTGKQHYALGTIEYGNGSGERGYLLYIKSSMGGKHSPYIDDYHFNHPDFPHESTADQFFDEAQFEAYRAMGCEIGDDVLKCIGAGTGVLDDQSGEKTQARALDAERNWREFLVAAGKQSHAFTQA